MTARGSTQPTLGLLAVLNLVARTVWLCHITSERTQDMSDDVRPRREALGLSRQQLADLAGTTASGVWSVENGRSPRGGDGVRLRVLEALERRESGGKPEVAPKTGRAAQNAARVQEDFATAHPDWTVSYEWNGLNVNDAVAVSGAPGAFRFVKHVRTDAGKEWVDVMGGKGGKLQSRSFDPARVTAVRTRSSRRRGPGEDVDRRSRWRLRITHAGVSSGELTFATYEDARAWFDAHERLNFDDQHAAVILNPHDTVIFEYPAQDGLSKIAREKMGVDI